MARSILMFTSIAMLAVGVWAVEASAQDQGYYYDGGRRSYGYSHGSFYGGMYFYAPPYYGPYFRPCYRYNYAPRGYYFSSDPGHYYPYSPQQHWRRR